MNIAIILAGGKGTRFGAVDAEGQAVPKQFVEVFGKPVIAYTIEAFQNHPDIDAIEIVCVEGYREHLQAIKEKYGFSKIWWITPGGRNFQESVLNGVMALEGKANEEDVVLVNFGVNPIVSQEIISDCIKVTKEKGNAISAIDFYDISGRKKNGSSVGDKDNYTAEMIDRDSVAIMRTPYGFQYGFIRDAYQEALDKGILDEIEEHTTSMLYALGKTMYFSLGSQANIKITRKEDLDFFAGYVMWKKELGQQKGKRWGLFAD